MSTQRIYMRCNGRRRTFEIWENSLRKTNYPHLHFVYLCGDSWFPVQNKDRMIIDINVSTVDEDIYRFFRESVDEQDILNWEHKDSIAEAKRYAGIDLQGVEFLDDWQEEPCYRALEKWYTEYIDNVSADVKQNLLKEVTKCMTK